MDQHELSLHRIYTWQGAQDGSNVKLPDWVHECLLGWSGEHLYLTTDEDNYTVEIGDTIGYLTNDHEHTLYVTKAETA